VQGQSTPPLAVNAEPNLHTGRKKILIVDDSLIILRVLSMKLKNSGYDVLTAQDGAAAVSTTRRERPDLIVLDLLFPPDVAHGGGVAWDGFLIMDWVRRLEGGKDIPIIVITGGDAAQFKDRSLAAGAIAFFHKPINNDELLSTIRLSLEATATAPNSENRNPKES
jgi:CheY-like chemotaxis protein